jgi:hypothetical protein
MTTPTTPAEERLQSWEFAGTYSDPEYCLREAVLERYWETDNNDLFDGRLEVPHLGFGRTGPRDIVDVSRLTPSGGQLQILLNPGLIFGESTRAQRVNRKWVQRDWDPAGSPDQGIARFIRDSLRKAMCRQACIELGYEDPPSYRGYGPAFVAEANRVGLLLGLSPVAVDARRASTADQPLARGWPHIVRGRDYYGDDVTDALWVLATSSRNRRDQASAPGLGTYEYFLYLLNLGQADRLREILIRQVDWLGRQRQGGRPVSRRMERGEVDTDGTSLLGDVVVSPAWLTENNAVVRKLAEGILLARSFGDLPILADALDDAGCRNGAMLRHLWAPIEHTRDCWVLRLLVKQPVGGD